MIILRIMPKSVQENRVAVLLNKKFVEHKFIRNGRYEWIINPKTGKHLELDFYCPEIKLAIEVNGIQHYEPGHFGMTKEEFEEQQYRDWLKVQRCKEKGVNLIIIRYDQDSDVEVKKIYDNFMKKCKNDTLDVWIKNIKNNIYKDIFELHNKDPDNKAFYILLGLLIRCL